jgi:hypothetical protein
MQYGNDCDAIHAQVIEERVRKTSQKNTTECPMRLMKRQRMPLRKIDRFVDSDKEVVTKVA